MIVEYKKVRGKSYMQIAIESENINKFELNMIGENIVEGLLECELIFIDGKSKLCYDITSKQNLKTIYENKRLSYKDLKTIILGLTIVIDNIGNYLLDENRLELRPELIFLSFDTPDVFICYNLEKKSTYEESIIDLSEYLLKKIDNNDKDALHLAYTLNSVAIEERCNTKELRKLLVQGQMGHQSVQQKEDCNGSYVEDVRKDCKRRNDSKYQSKVLENDYECINEGYINEGKLNSKGKLNKKYKFNKEDKSNKEDRYERYDKEDRYEQYYKEDRFERYDRYDKEEQEDKYDNEDNNENSIVEFFKNNISFKDEKIIKSLILSCVGIVLVLLILFLTFSRNILPIEQGVLAITGVLIAIIYVVMWIFKEDKEKRILEELTRKDYKDTDDYKDIENYKEQEIHKIRKNNKDLEDHNYQKENRRQIDSTYLSNRLPENTVLLGVREANYQRELMFLDNDEVDEKKNIIIKKYPYIIGKIKDSVDEVINNPLISRIHAKLSKEEEKIVIEDMNSTNGTFVNGYRLLPYSKKEIVSGDKIRFGSHEYMLK